MTQRVRSLFVSRAVAALAGAVLFTSIALAAPPVPATAPSAGATTPETVVLSLTNDVLDAIRKDKAMQSGDLVLVQKLVDERILPHVDFDKMTRLSVGPLWRGATPEQRAALIRQFRLLLLRTYSGALSQVADQQVQLRRAPERLGPTDVIVRTRIVSAQADPVDMDFRLEPVGDDWKIYDIDILGVWLVENYRGEFAEVLNRGGIDVLIQALTEKNQKLARLGGAS
jgi:phospholipid transport system substrate-binding protein